MKNNILSKKGTVFGIMLLLVFMSVVPLTSGADFRKKIESNHYGGEYKDS